MDSLSFYIVFHQKLFPENTPKYSCFKYIGVNENIKKEIDLDKLQHPVIYEYDIPTYNPIYQILKLCENSVILNLPAPPTPFIGLCQYDMRINSEEFNFIFDNLDTYKSMIGFFAYHIDTIQDDVFSKKDWEEVLNIYNSDNKTSHTIELLEDIPFFLMNTYILPSWFFTKLQLQLKRLLPVILKLLDYNIRHMGGTLEATNALIIACAIKEGTLFCKISNAIQDEETQKIKDPFKHGESVDIPVKFDN
jgi:hypothetical protein